MRKVTLILPEQEYHAIYALANRELRTPNDQIVWMIRQEAARQGLIELDATQERNDETVNAEQQRTTR